MFLSDCERASCFVKTHSINPECDPSRPVTPSCVIRQDHGYKQLRDIVTHRDKTWKEKCMFNVLDQWK